MGISAVVYVHDLAKMTSFYSVLLGLAPTTVAEDQDWVELSADGIQLWLHRVGPAWRVDEPGHLNEIPREENPIKLVFSMASIENLDVRIRESGGSTIARAWGNDFSDPEGNVFSVLHSTTE